MPDVASHEGQDGAYPRIVPAGDSAILIELGSEIDPVINDQVYALVSSIGSS